MWMVSGCSLDAAEDSAVDAVVIQLGCCRGQCSSFVVGQPMQDCVVRLVSRAVRMLTRICRMCFQVSLFFMVLNV